MTLLIFDIDGTLTDTTEVDDHCFSSAFQDEYGIELINVDWATFTNVTDYGLYLELYKFVFDKTPTEGDKLSFQNRFFNYLDKKLETTPHQFKSVNGASIFVNHCLMQANFQIAFATGGWQKSAKLKLKAANISYDNIPLSSCDIFCRRQDILLDVIGKSKQHYQTKTFDNVVYFGDGVWDFKTTTELQIPFVGVDIFNNNKLKELGVQNVINDFTNIDAIFLLIEKTTTTANIGFMK